MSLDTEFFILNLEVDNSGTTYYFLFSALVNNSLEITERQKVKFVIQTAAGIKVTSFCTDHSITAKPSCFLPEKDVSIVTGTIVVSTIVISAIVAAVLLTILAKKKSKFVY